MKAKGIFISTLLVIDTFFVSFYFGVNSRSVSIVNPKLPPVTPAVAPAPKTNLPAAAKTTRAKAASDNGAKSKDTKSETKKPAATKSTTTKQAVPKTAAPKPASKSNTAAKVKNTAAGK